MICGGGHTLMSESLYYGKPVLSLPLQTAIEQCANAMFLERNGWGLHRSMDDLGPGLVPEFESRVEEYRTNVGRANFRGNEEVFALVEGFIREKRLVLRPAPRAGARS